MNISALPVVEVVLLVIKVYFGLSLLGVVPGPFPPEGGLSYALGGLLLVSACASIYRLKRLYDSRRT